MVYPLGADNSWKCKKFDPCKGKKYRPLAGVGGATPFRIPFEIP
jgi:hypothetical protein